MLTEPRLFWSWLLIQLLLWLASLCIAYHYNIVLCHHSQSKSGHSGLMFLIWHLWLQQSGWFWAKYKTIITSSSLFSLHLFVKIHLPVLLVWCEKYIEANVKTKKATMKDINILNMGFGLMWITALTMGKALATKWEESLNPKATFKRLFTWSHPDDSCCSFAAKGSKCDKEGVYPATLCFSLKDLSLSLTLPAFTLHTSE